MLSANSKNLFINPFDAEGYRTVPINHAQARRSRAVVHLFDDVMYVAQQFAGLTVASVQCTHWLSNGLGDG